MPAKTALNELWKKAVEFGDERKSNKQDLSGLNAFPDVLLISSCEDRRLLIEENMNLNYAIVFHIGQITSHSHRKHANVH